MRGPKAQTNRRPSIREARISLGFPVVQRLGGLLLECLDPTGIQSTVKGLSSSRKRNIGRLGGEKPLIGCKEIQSYGWHWRTLRLSGLIEIQDEPVTNGPKASLVLIFCMRLVHWMPELHDDPEGQVYLGSVCTRQLGAAEQVSGFKTRVVTDPKEPRLCLTNLSLTCFSIFSDRLLRARRKVDEELIESFPSRSVERILSIHQSKGLEFPLALSLMLAGDFRSKHHAHAFKRFPKFCRDQHKTLKT